MKCTLLRASVFVFVVGAAVVAGGCSRSNDPFLLPPPAPYNEPAGSPWQHGGGTVGGEEARPAPTPAPTPTPAPAPTPSPRAAAPRAEGEIRAEHILVMHRESMRVPPGITRTKDEARVRAEQVLQRVRAQGANFGTIAAEMSDEPGHETKRGDLGSFGRGMMVPPFEAAAFALSPGQISGIVETPFGFHVIRRVE